MNTNTVYAILGIATIIILFTVNRRIKNERVKQLESDYQMDLNGDSIILKDKGRKVGAYHYKQVPQLDSLICIDNQ